MTQAKPRNGKAAATTNGKASTATATAQAPAKAAPTLLERANTIIHLINKSYQVTLPMRDESRRTAAYYYLRQRIGDEVQLLLLKAGSPAGKGWWNEWNQIWAKWFGEAEKPKFSAETMAGLFVHILPDLPKDPEAAADYIAQLNQADLRERRKRRTDTPDARKKVDEAGDFDLGEEDTASFDINSLDVETDDDDFGEETEASTDELESDDAGSDDDDFE